MATTVAVHAGQLLQPVPGGIGRYVRAMLRTLPVAGVEPVAFAAGSRPPGLAARIPWVDLGQPHGGVRYELWHRLRRPVVGIDAHVAHAPSLAVPPVRIPLVVTVHDIAFLRMPGATTARGVRFHRRGLEVARRDAELIIAPSEFTKRELVGEGFDRTRITVAPFGVDPPAARDTEELDATLAHAGVREPFVLTVGTVEPRKDLPTLVRAVERLRRRHPSLTLVVNGPRGWGEVAELDCSFVRVLGAQPWRVVDALYRKAAVFCVASLYEGFGLPALEAMAHGTPTIATTGSAMEEFVRDAGLLFEPRNVDECADALASVLDDDIAREELARSGQAKADTMTWERCAHIHADVYARAAARGRS
jgi:glycosyltransferase involved in cell wall biosynthesis